MIRTRAGAIVGDTGPVQRIIRRGEMPTVTGYCIDYIYELIRAGKFSIRIALATRLEPS